MVRMLARYFPSPIAALVPITDTLTFATNVSVSVRVLFLKVNISFVITPTIGGALEIDMAVRNDLFGMARNMAGNMIVQKLRGVSMLSCMRNKKGNLTIVIHGIEFTCFDVSGGTVTVGFLQ